MKVATESVKTQGRGKRVLKIWRKKERGERERQGGGIMLKRRVAIIPLWEWCQKGAPFYHHHNWISFTNGSHNDFLYTTSVIRI